MMDAKTFLKDAHRHGHRGPLMVRRWAIHLNTDRRSPAVFVSVDMIEEAVELERAEEEGRLAFD